MTKEKFNQEVTKNIEKMMEQPKMTQEQKEKIIEGVIRVAHIQLKQYGLDMWVRVEAYPEPTLSHEDYMKWQGK